MKQFLIILVTLLFISCHPTGKEVAGKYCTQLKSIEQCIKMHKDGTFTQSLRTKNKNIINTGEWKFEYQLGQEKLMLSNFVSFYNPIEENGTPDLDTGSVSCYWYKNKIDIYPSGYDEYNYHQQED